MRPPLFTLLALLLALPLGAEARRPRRRDKRPNLPLGWSYPPTPAMAADGRRCLAHLTELGLPYQAVTEPVRRVATPIVLLEPSLGDVRLVPTGPAPRRLLMDCRFAEAMLTEGAPRLRAQGVTELRYSSIHVDRTIARRRVISRHALGLAVDVFAFVTDDGALHTVLTDYRRGDPVLRGIEAALDGAESFRGVITPGKDRRGHRDHFHLEARTFGDPTPRRSLPES